MSRRRKNGLPVGALIALVAVAAVLCIGMVIVMYMNNHGMLGGGDEAGSGELSESGQNEMDLNANFEGNGEVVVFGDTRGLEMPDFDGRLFLSDADLETVKPDHDTVDIEKLREEVNPEIFAWLYIPGAGVDRAVLMREEDDDVLYYQSHNEKGDVDPYGAVFAQKCNQKEFKDYVTVIYGSNETEADQFGGLSNYRDQAFFSSHPLIYVYTEGKLFVYKIFAAYEFEDYHIMMYYSPTIDSLYERYLTELEKLPGPESNVDRNEWPDKNDKILTLSTHIDGKPDKRFLVQARLSGIKNL